jgi:hypothetical protein
MPLAAQAPTVQPPAPDPIGSVTTLQGVATVTRGNSTGALQVNDDIYKGDLLQTAGNATLAITLDDETTFTMGANARMTMDEFAYQQGRAHTGTYNVLRGTVAFVAGQVAKTGTMSITTPTATIGIRGTTGVVEVPEGITTASQVHVKLYPDANGAVGRIEVFAPGAGGARLGILTRAASGFGIGAAVGGRFAAVPLTISSQQVARDRGFVRQMYSYHSLGQRNVIERRNLRQQGLPPNLRQNQQRQNLQRQNPQQQNQQRPPDQRRQGLGRSPNQGAPNVQGRPSRQHPDMRVPGTPGQRAPGQPGQPVPGVQPPGGPPGAPGLRLPGMRGQPVQRGQQPQVPPRGGRVPPTRELERQFR